MLTEQSRLRERAACISTTHLYLSDCSSTSIFKRTGISGPRLIRGGGGVRPSLSLIGLDHDVSLTCLFLNSRETFRVAETFVFFLEWLDAL